MTPKRETEASGLSSSRARAPSPARSRHRSSGLRLSGLGLCGLSRGAFYLSWGSVLLWLGALLCLRASAQYKFDLWTVDNGLPQNIIRAICQTSDGYLWLATLDGLVRFDGVRFTVFDKSNTPGISSNRFVSMYEDRGGDLWLDIEGGGLTRFHQGSFHTYGTDLGIYDSPVRALAGDASGNIWIVVGDKIAHWNDITGRFVDITPKGSKVRYAPFRWESAGFWGWDETSLHCFFEGRFVTFPLPSWLPGKSIWGVARDPSGTIWIETLDGRQASISPDKPQIELISHSHLPTISYVGSNGHSWTMHIGPRLDRSLEYLSTGRSATITFSRIYQDRQQNLWLGTEGQGLYRMQKQTIQVYSKEQGLIDRNVYPILQDHTGAVWIGAWQQGLSRLDRGKVTNYTVADGLPGRLITALAEDSEGRLWVSAHDNWLAILDHGKFHKSLAPTLPDGAVTQAIFEDRSKTMWIGTNQGLVRFKDGASELLTTADGLAADDVRVIIEGASGDLWIGGYGGLTRIRNGHFTHWNETDGLPSKNIRTVYEDGDGILWIGTYDGGLGRLADGKFTRYSVRDGLFNNGVFQILEDMHGNLWMSSNRGIHRVRKQELNEFAAGERRTITSTAYGKIDGMLNVECNGGLWPSGIKARDGKLLFPTQDGVAVVDPDAVSSDLLPPPVMIESSFIDRLPTPVTAPLLIPAGKENLEIEYTAPSFIKPEQIRFKYKLEGLESKWVDAGARRTAYYSHIPPGKYLFHVIAANSDGVWNSEGSRMAVTVEAPFYKRGWFAALMVLPVALLMMMAWLYRVSRLKAKQAAQKAFSQELIASQERERKRIAADLHDGLGQRLVIINHLALNSLQARAKAASTQDEVSALEEISAEVLLAIKETREISYDLRPFQLDRLGLSKAIASVIRTVSTASGIAITSEIDNIDDFFPEELRINFYRIVQESLTNIVKHARATQVNVRIQRDNRHMMLTVHDNGAGFVPEHPVQPVGRAGFGLSGMAERTNLLGGKFKVRSIAGQGTKVTVEILSGRR